MNLLERYPPTLELAQAYSEHAPVASTLPWFSRGREYARRSLAIRKDFGDAWGQGQSLGFYGIVLYAGSRFDQAIENLTEAIRLLERTGDRWEINTALWHLGFCHYRLGQTDDARRAFARCHANAVEIGDHQALGIALSGLAKVSGGQVEAADMGAALEACKGDLHTTGEVVTGEAIRLLHAGQAVAAADLLADGHRQVAKARVRNEYVAPILPWRVTALRVAAESTDPLDARERQRLLRIARRTSWRARIIAAAYRNNLPHVLREQATVAMLLGHERRARRLLTRGIAIAEELSMLGELEVLRSLHDRAPWTPSHHSPSAPEHDEFTGAVAVDESSVSLSLADRFDTLLTVGRTIATALTEDDIWLNVRRATMELLRGETSSVVLLEGGPNGELRLVPMGGSDEVASEQLVLRAARAGGVVRWTDEDADPTESMLFNRTRCALAAPVYCRGTLVACWYVSHSGVGSLFGPDEFRIAEYISALASAALENAEGFAEVQALTHSLEQRVADRTVELEHANEELRRLDELKSEFVAMTSHELRSPLTSMLGFCRVALRHWDKIDDEKKREFMTTVERQGNRLATLTEDLLQMARIESGHLRTALEPVEVRDLCAEVIADFSSRSTEIGLRGPAASAMADREHLRRVVINLVDNALKYGEPPVDIEISVDSERVLISIRDHGAGVPEDFVPQLFDRFAQASSGTTRQATGTGLGMAIVRGLVDAMHGEITYRPAPGSGAEFIVELAAASN
jgi:two-component system sensor kinase